MNNSQSASDYWKQNIFLRCMENYTAKDESHEQLRSIMTKLIISFNFMNFNCQKLFCVILNKNDLKIHVKKKHSFIVPEFRKFIF